MRTKIDKSVSTKPIKGMHNPNNPDSASQSDQDPSPEKSLPDLLGTDLTFQSIYCDAEGIVRVRNSKDN